MLNSKLFQNIVKYLFPKVLTLATQPAGCSPYQFFEIRSSFSSILLSNSILLLNLQSLINQVLNKAKESTVIRMPPL